MKKFHVVNYHITNRCNYHCAYCFGKFDGQKDPMLEDAKRIVDNIASYFFQNEITDGRINFAGGEPTLYAHLDELINYASSLGIRVSIVTNGSLLTPELVCSWQGKVSCIGISIDSIDNNTNITIGRCCRNKAKDLPHWNGLAKAIHECNIDLKVNTVVSRLNLDEDLSELYRALGPKKIKLFQMHLIDGINDQAKSYEITEREFVDFCERHRAFESVMVAEPCGSMENSYLMVNPKGKFQLNNNGAYQTFGDLNTTSILEILKTVPLDFEKFDSRYVKEAVK
jgi:radical S-adenosyl methionine domain-containing protein 2